jgi:Na+/melibiose symporter-like transporter
MTIPLQVFGFSMSMSSLAFAPNVFMKVFGGDSTVIGLLSLLSVPYDIANTPFFGRLSDRGFFNKACFANVDAWGRRAPLVAISMPFCMLFSALMWVGPESIESALAVAIWYGVVVFALKTFGSMYMVAMKAAFTELFPSKAERVRLGVAKVVALLFGMGVGAAIIAPAAVAAEDSDSERTKFRMFAVITAGGILLAIPYMLLQRRTIMTTSEADERSLWRVTVETWQSSFAFRCFAVAQHLITGASWTTLFALPLFLQEAVGLRNDQLEMALRRIMLGSLGCMILSMPVVYWLVRRYDPSRIAGIGGLLAVIKFFCHGHWYYSGPGRTPQVYNVLMCGFGLATVFVTWNVCADALFAYIVDEDMINRMALMQSSPSDNLSESKIPARRDGIFNSIKISFAITGTAWPALLQVLLGILGYDGERYARGEKQPQAVCTAIVAVYVYILPVMFAAFAIPMFLFPLRGKRLKGIRTSYSEVYKAASAEDARRRSVRTSQVRTSQCSVSSVVSENKVENEMCESAAKFAGHTVVASFTPITTASTPVPSACVAAVSICPAPEAASNSSWKPVENLSKPTILDGTEQTQDAISVTRPGQKFSL